MAEQTSTYPRVLREAWFSRILAGLGLVVGVVAVIAIFGLASDLLSSRAQPWRVLLIPAMAWIAWMSVKMFCDTALTSITLARDSFEARGPLVNRRLQRAQIAGYRIIERSRLPSRLRIEMADPAEKPLEVNLVDASAIGAWFQQAPTLDKQEAARTRQIMLDDPAYGATAEERANALRNWSKVGGAASLIGLAVAAWAAFAPQPRGVLAVVVLLLPLAGFTLLAFAGRRVTAMGSTSDPRATLIGLFIGGAALGVRDLLFERTLMDDTLLLVPAAALGLAGLGALWFLDRAVFTRNGAWGLAATMLVAWALGDLTEANVQLDRATPRIYTTRVTDKHVWHGRSTHWEVTLAPWGPRAGPTAVDDATLYNKVQLGQQMCVALHPGALGAPWREITPCQDADTAKA